MTTLSSDLFDAHSGHYIKGDNDRYIDKEELLRILADLLRSGTYQTPPDDGAHKNSGELAVYNNGELAVYNNNASYWQDASKNSVFFHKMPILLEGFWILEWAQNILLPTRYKAVNSRKGFSIIIVVNICRLAKII
jgi:hypothetical protein